MIDRIEHLRALFVRVQLEIGDAESGERRRRVIDLERVTIGVARALELTPDRERLPELVPCGRIVRRDLREFLEGVDRLLLFVLLRVQIAETRQGVGVFVVDLERVSPLAFGAREVLVSGEIVAVGDVRRGHLRIGDDRLLKLALGLRVHLLGRIDAGFFDRESHLAGIVGHERHQLVIIADRTFDVVFGREQTRLAEQRVGVLRIDRERPVEELTGEREGFLTQVGLRLEHDRARVFRIQLRGFFILHASVVVAFLRLEDGAVILEDLFDPSD